MKLDLFLKNGLLVLPGEGVVPGGLGIRGGKIVLLAGSGEDFAAARSIDCQGQWVMPGVIDPHVHFGFGDPENDFRTESRSAALGGVTSVISFYRTKDFRKGFDAERARAESQSVIDFSYHLGLTNDLHVKTLAECYERFGISSYKMYMMYKGQAGLAKGLTDIDDGLLFAAMRETADLPGAILGVHCENVEVIPYLRDPLRAAGRDDLVAWDEQSPDFLEAENVHRVCYFARKTGCAVNIVHLSSKEALDEVRRHRYAGGPPMYVETCPHYLFTDKHDPAGVLAKANPPLRSQADVDALWEGILDGTVTTVGTDHVPRKRATKEKSVWTATNGLPGVATFLPILMEVGYHQRQVPPEVLAMVASRTAARLYNMHGKGTLAPGADADIVVVDPNLERVVDPDTLGSFSDYSPFEGRSLRGWPTMTFSRGRLLVESGQLTDEAVDGSGHFLPRLPKHQR